MNLDIFDLVERTIQNEGPDAGIELLIRRLFEAKEYQLVLEARLMQKRRALGLPLIFDGGDIVDVPADKRDAYRVALTEAAREAGSSYLADGDIGRAWTYFRAIGDPEPVAAAIDAMHPATRVDDVLVVGLFDGVNPRKGFELLLEHRGVCQGIDFVMSCTNRHDRLICLRMLVRTFCRQLAARLKEVIICVEAKEPRSASIAELIKGREWLFIGRGFYIENSHLASILRASPELDDSETMQLAVELSEYAQQLDPIHRLSTEAPFEDPFVDPAKYLRALLGENIEEGVNHFRQKVECGVRGAPEALVNLLTRLGRYEEAIQTSTDHLHGHAGDDCPSAVQLCELAGNYQRLREVARNERDLLGFTAGLLLVT